MKDIQAQVYNVLTNIFTNNNVYAYMPPAVFEEGFEEFITLNELENNPAFYSDSKEDFSVIYYNFNLYTKYPDNFNLTNDINNGLVEQGFTRITAGTTIWDNTNNYYVRLLTYKIQI